MARTKSGSAWSHIPESLLGSTDKKYKFGEKEAICGIRCPHPDWDTCGSKGSKPCEFYLQEIKKLKESKTKQNP